MNAATNVQAEMELVPGNVKQIMKQYRQGSADIYMVSLDAIRVRPGFNAPRLADPDYPAAVREYADSMKVNGFFRHKPLKVCAAVDGYLYLSDGHTRWDAVQLANSEGAGIEAVPVVNEERGTTEEDRLFGKYQDNNGRKLTPLGEAILFKDMLGRGISEETIARRLPCSITKVRNALDLLSAPTPIREAVQAGEVSATAARKLVKESGADAVGQLEAAREIAKASGKTKVTPKALKAVGGQKQTARSNDTEMLDWIQAQGSVSIGKMHVQGEPPVFRVSVLDLLLENPVAGEGADLRAAIVNARERGAK
ncbi:ParB/RepB/Spo0J family partition protein [Burkholderia cenocepacia]|uniref:ParB/RepB/Spo0J family partition protein n=1 Tax=Burkholderia cenocepacia TaxID=95486 RepID=UPI001CF12D07|nr:ParB/RepB/Spo0J family partition protein [Burkholderia cenocepacia]MCA7962396.1 ParB/RepB/Spo0J family partition protein [Burkholderia cenocepacia]MDR8054417.1 ParB/RepB/Spo0J family partition protein [Burkholderia cenocepacia]MDR8064860.1 ParB/RepB/Spo0J family partition protein [Burkholderia cenocepacia]